MCKVTDRKEATALLYCADILLYLFDWEFLMRLMNAIEKYFSFTDLFIRPGTVKSNLTGKIYCDAFF